MLGHLVDRIMVLIDWIASAGMSIPIYGSSLVPVGNGECCLSGMLALFFGGLLRIVVMLYDILE